MTIYCIYVVILRVQNSHVTLLKNVYIGGYIDRVFSSMSCKTVDLFRRSTEVMGESSLSRLKIVTSKQNRSKLEIYLPWCRIYWVTQTEK